MQTQLVLGTNYISTFGFPRSPFQAVFVNGRILPKNKQEAIVRATEENFLKDGIDRVRYSTDSDGIPVLVLASRDEQTKAYGIKPHPSESIFYSLRNSSVTKQVTYQGLPNIDGLFTGLSNSGYLNHRINLFLDRLEGIGLVPNNVSIGRKDRGESLKVQVESKLVAPSCEIQIQRDHDLQESDQVINILPDKDQRNKLRERIRALFFDNNGFTTMDRIIDYGFEKEKKSGVPREEYYVKIKDDKDNIYTIIKRTLGFGNTLCEVKIEFPGDFLPVFIAGLEGLSDLFDREFLDRMFSDLETQRQVWAIKTISQNLAAIDPEVSMTEAELSSLFLDEK